ncbi:signal peptidase I [Ornithinimicrobium sp. W1679]|uniref:signal peptidase I n=1 Tax=unclassified Ornithinimicrobium TaxID=2615080 RepID=UPI003CF5D43C
MATTTTLGAAAALTLLGVAVARAFVLTPFEVASDSMAPTLEPGSTILVDRLSLHWDDVDHQDLVLFDGADGAVVKRVVGLPGERIEILDAVLHVDGQPVEEPYVDDVTLDGVFFGPVQVPDDHVFVLGDNRFDSIDSRRLGPVPLDAITGRVIHP